MGCIIKATYEKTTCKYQVGFRPSCGCTDQTFTLQRPTAVAFLNFKGLLWWGCQDSAGLY